MNEVGPIRDKKQLEKMKTYLRSHRLRDYALFVLGINSGLRVSDLLSLKVSQVFDQNRLLKNKIILKEQKTGKTKSFPINDNARKALTEYAKASTELYSEEFLFPSQRGGKLSRMQEYRIINHAALVAGVQGNIGTHTMRKTFGYHAYKQCGDIVLVMKLLNHSSPDHTLRYIGITEEECDNMYFNVNL